MHRVSACLLAAILLLPPAAPAADDHPIDLRWKTRTQDYFEYTVSSVTEANGQVVLTPQPARAFSLFGYEVDPKGAYAPRPSSTTDLVTAWLLGLPAGKMKPGGSLKVIREYEQIGGVNPFVLHGDTRLVGFEEIDKARVAVLETRLQFAPAPQPGKAGPNPESNQTVAEGRLAFTQYVDPELGRLVRARYDLATTQVYSPKYKEKVKKDSNTDLQDVHVNLTEQWDLASVREVPKLDLGVPVRDAIDKGVAFLRTKQEADGGWDGGEKQNYAGGPTALVLLALLRAGVSPKDAAVARGFTYLRKQPLAKTYVVGLTMMAIEARYIPAGEAQNSEAFLEGKQSELKVVRRNVTKEDQAWLGEGTAFFERAMTNEGAWGYQGAATGTGTVAVGYDHSNSQYGVLGLLSAARCGVAVRTATWQAVLKHWLATQEGWGPSVRLLLRGYRDQDACEAAATARGWGYGDASKTPQTTSRNAPPVDTRGSMTCAGISSVCLARAQLAALRALTPDQAAAAEKAVQDGLAWMHEHFTVKEAVYTTGWYYYYMYGLERAMILAQQKYLGGHDWYKEGAVVLLGRQTGDGAWANSCVETSFCILFLKRATTPIFSK